MNTKKNMFHLKIFIFKPESSFLKWVEKANAFFCSFKPVRGRSGRGEPEEGDVRFPRPDSSDHFWYIISVKPYGNQTAHFIK